MNEQNKFSKKNILQSYVLNEQQMQAVETIDGPVMVVAGPGTGKTQVLAARIARILEKTDTAPHAILALTFTEAAAKNLRERVVRLVGHEGYYVHIATFHSFCSRVIVENPEYFSTSAKNSSVSQLEQHLIIESILLSGNFVAIKPLNSPLHYLKECLHQISVLKRENITPARFAEIVRVQVEEFKSEEETYSKSEKVKRLKNIDKLSELLRVYELYEEALRDRGVYDYDDMIRSVVEAFLNHDSLLRDYQEQFLYFMIDEYQDTNNAQNKIIELLAAWWTEDANVFVVGDPHQSIYRFQGASLENMLSFVTQYPNATIITLEQGYRCPQEIYDAAHTLISHNSIEKNHNNARILAAVSKKIVSVQTKSHQKKIELYRAPTAHHQVLYIAAEIKRLLNNSVNPNDIAVIYRNRADVIELEEILQKRSLPYTVIGSKNILDDEYIRQLIVVMQVIVELRDGTETMHLFQTLCFEWIPVSSSIAVQLARVAATLNISLKDVFNESYESLKEKIGTLYFTEKEFTDAKKFVDALMYLSSLDQRKHIVQWLEEFLEKSGYADWAIKKLDQPKIVTHLIAFTNLIKQFAKHNHELKVDELINLFTTMKEHGVHLDADALEYQTERVTLSTAHSAKGLEWKYVFIFDVLDGKWGNKRKNELLPLPSGIVTYSDLSKKEKNEDERRLFYVAITRASEKVTIVYPESSIIIGRVRSHTHSMFLLELQHHIASIDEGVRDQFHKDAEKLAVQAILPKPSGSFASVKTNFFENLINNFSLSVTSLNKYLRSPRDFIIEDLLRMPRAKVDAMVFGTAIHASLDAYNKTYIATKKPPSVEHILGVFTAALEKELLTSSDFLRRKKQGLDVLSSYLQNRQSDQLPLFSEKHFGSTHEPVLLGDIRLTGRIDRIDLVSEKEKQVRVVDYKTGAARSVNYIEGATTSSPLSERELQLPEPIRGRMKRQLLFYKLLAKLDVRFPYTVTMGAFDFVEPTSSGKHVQREFILKDEDVALLVSVIKQVMGELRSLSFLNEVPLVSFET